MSYPTSTPQMPSYGQWPVMSDPGDRAVRSDVVAAVLLILGGGAGIAQLWVPWLRGAGGDAGGWDLFQSLKAALRVQGGVAPTLGAYAVLAVMVLGVALVLLGVLMLLPLDHRPPGVVAIVAALIAVLCAVWWVFWHGGTGDLGSLFSTGWIGWYLFLVSGLVALAGAVKGLVSST
jgi:hypothetical protein